MTCKLTAKGEAETTTFLTARKLLLLGLLARSLPPLTTISSVGFSLVAELSSPVTISASPH